MTQATTAVNPGISATREMAMIALLAISGYVIGITLSDAFAAGSQVGATLCAFAGQATGSIGSAFATLGVIIVGAMACLGKASWSLAVTVIVGIAVLFNASEFVTIAGGTGTCGGAIT